MKQRIITGAVFALVVAIFIIPGYWYPALPLLLLLLVGWFSMRELTGAFSRSGLRPGRAVLYLSLALAAVPPLLAPGFAPTLAVMLFALLLMMIISCLYLLLTGGPAALPSAVLTAALVAYIVFPLISASVLLYKVEQGWMWLVIGLAAPWVSDVFAFFTGSFLGRHPIVPAISPKKTVEGFFGGLAGGILIMWVALAILEPLYAIRPDGRLGHTVFIVLGGIFMSVASQFGDWLASGMKRWCRIKDFGQVLPGHGGVIDRFDSAFFTLPAAVILAAVYNYLIII